MSELKKRAERVGISARAAVNSPGAVMIPPSVRGLVVEMCALLEGLAFAVEELEKREREK